MPYRVNGQYIMEGLASSFLFTMGGLGFVILDQTNKPTTPRLNRILLLCISFVCILLSFFMCRVFMRMKLPWVWVITGPNSSCGKVMFLHLSVSHSVHRGWGVSQYAMGQLQATPRANTPQVDTPLWANSPPDRQTPPPWADAPYLSYLLCLHSSTETVKCGRYASYWNAVLVCNTKATFTHTVFRTVFVRETFDLFWRILMSCVNSRIVIHWTHF